MGMSAGYELARRGLKTLLIDAFNPPHIMGSHHGEPRLIRHAYAGGEAYVRMALRADEKWVEIEERTGEKLLDRAGVLNMADTAVYSYEARRDDASALDVHVEWLDAADINRRWPNIKLPEHYRGMYEPNAGYLFSEKCIEAYKRLALEAGAELLPNTFVTGIKAEQGGVTVQTNHESFAAGHVILSAGAWFKTLEPFISLPIRTIRKVVGWFEPADSSFNSEVFPGFTLGTQNGGYYGFPSIRGAGLKIGRHDTGEHWQPGDELAPFGAFPEDEDDLRSVLEAFMPGAAGKLLRSAVCKYEHTPDDNFIIDSHPEHANVLLAGGFSGHGFKFSSVVGEILADLVEKGKSEQDLRLFSLSRFAAIT
ncbi:N-methyl-L-tryptophan oxidase [Paenibacillus baekrokdamisoli]|uniref:N-methyl-L-tryptophan oxidase n=2 Tax=Paenibacillus baekrokdamisoli TaxID=1712516 RepID=A0A3G9JF29_9BACL|nr:N-methyl-L-tryptophan oxidase [Paenibacillus baekrokdamisoli]BBH21569.1 N-methyl-L-tryptophan oxidase [Paenibacillus baekrokdamisoli]